MTAVIAAQGLTKSYGTRRALVDATLAIAPGEMVVVLGASGSGKTTLFRCLTRLVEPDSGSISLAGQPFSALRGRELQAARRRIGVVFQQFNLVRRRSAIDNVLAGRLAGVPLWRVIAGVFPETDRRVAVEALVAVGLGEHLDQRADTLSGGQQQRVAIARALAQKSSVILADEPVASLDPETAEQVLTLMKTLAERHGIGVLATLHQPQLAQRFGDRILRMEDGRLV